MLLLCATRPPYSSSAPHLPPSLLPLSATRSAALPPCATPGHASLCGPCQQLARLGSRVGLQGSRDEGHVRRGCSPAGAGAG
eukprot:227927-Rhodomonas_salina.1